MLAFLQQPWHWAVGGFLLGLTVPILLLLGNKKFAISSNLRHICAMCLPANIPFFKYDWKKESWNLLFILGLILGAIIASTLLKNPEPVKVADHTMQVLNNYGITEHQHLLPAQIFTWENVFTLKGLIFFVIGGFLIGFGTRYAGGCTSGHSITGLSMLEWTSLVATICFMLGGFFTTQLLYPLIFKLF